MTYGAALRELRGAQKTAKGVSLYSRWINRPAGRVLAAGAYRMGLTPNQVTLVSAFFSFAAVAALALGRPSWGLAAAVYLGFAVGFAFDSADGQLARLRRESSPAGEWLDHIVDAAKITALHAAVLVSFHRFFDLPGPGWLLLPLGFQLAAVLIFTGGLLADKLKPKPGRAATGAVANGPAENHPTARGAVPTGPAENSPTAGSAVAAGAAATGPGAPAATPSRLRSVALLPVDYGVFCLVFLLLGSERVFLAGYAALFAVHVLFLAAFTAKWFRELTAIRPA